MENIVKEAVQRLKTQGLTPLSPCITDENGMVRMCTAAAFAAAGLKERFGHDASLAFEKKLSRSGELGPLYDAFTSLALPRALCDLMKIYNDSIAPEKRSEAVIEFLNNLPSYA